MMNLFNKSNLLGSDGIILIPLNNTMKGGIEYFCALLADIAAGYKLEIRPASR